MIGVKMGCIARSSLLLPGMQIELLSPHQVVSIVRCAMAARS